MTAAELARELAAARQRHEEKTARLLREARAQAIRAAVRPGASRAEVEEKARSFYPRLNPELLADVVARVCGETRDSLPDPPA